MNAFFDCLLGTEEVVANFSPSSEKHKQLITMNNYLKSYLEVYKLTQKEIVQLEAKKLEDLTEITKTFDKMRFELDSREELLKMKYTSMVNTFETSLKMDFDFLQEKCQSLCNVINEYSQKFQSPNKGE